MQSSICGHEQVVFLCTPAISVVKRLFFQMPMIHFCLTMPTQHTKMGSACVSQRVIIFSNSREHTHTHLFPMNNFQGKKGTQTNTIFRCYIKTKGELRPGNSTAILGAVYTLPSATEVQTEIQFGQSLEGSKQFLHTASESILSIIVSCQRDKNKIVGCE